MYEYLEYFAELDSGLGEMLRRRKEGSIDGLGNARVARVNSAEIFENVSLERAVPRLLEWTNERSGKKRLTRCGVVRMRTR